MREIGVRELKAHLSEALREVECGGELRVTSHGRPVAEIVPAGGEKARDPIRALVAQGRLTPPSLQRPRRAPRLVRGARSASELVLGERDDER